MEVINKDKYEADDTLTGQFTWTMSYAATEILDKVRATTTIIYISGVAITFSISFDMDVILDKDLFQIDLIKELRSYKVFSDNQVYEGDKGWYIFHRDTLNVINVTPSSVLVSMNINIYASLDEANKAVTKSIQHMCRMSYKDYKQTCEGLWDLRQDENISTREALDLFENLGSCISKRSVNLKECPMEDEKSRTGHTGAIFKLRKIRNFYGNLIIKRIRDDMK